MTINEKNSNGDKIRIRQASLYFGLSESYIRHAIMRRELPHYKLGRTVFLSRSEIESMIEAGKVS